MLPGYGTIRPLPTKMNLSKGAPSYSSAWIPPVEFPRTIVCPRIPSVTSRKYPRAVFFVSNNLSSYFSLSAKKSTPKKLSPANESRNPASPDGILHGAFHFLSMEHSVSCSESGISSDSFRAEHTQDHTGEMYKIFSPPLFYSFDFYR